MRLPIILLIVAAFILSENAFGSDTLLVAVFNYEERIKSIAEDENGRILATFLSGLYEVDPQTGELMILSKDFNGELFFLDSLYAIQKNPDSEELLERIQEKVSRDQIWLSQLPPSDHQSTLYVATDPLGNIYVASNFHIYKFRIQNIFRKVLTVHSARGLILKDDTLYCNTYSGLFKGRENIDFEIIGGDVFQSPEGEIFASSGSYFYKLTESGKEEIELGTHLSNWIKSQNRNIIRIQQLSDDGWLIGTDKGLALLTPDTNLIVLDSISIEEILPVQGGFLLSTSSDLLFMDEHLQTTSWNLSGHHFNQCISHGSSLLLATNQGVFSYSTSEGILKPVLTQGIDGKPLQIMSMLKDDHGFLWCGTGAGLYRVDLAEYSFSHYLTTTEFNKRSFFKSGGTMYMGAINGVYCWEPSNFLGPLTARAGHAWSSKELPTFSRAWFLAHPYSLAIGTMLLVSIALSVALSARKRNDLKHSEESSTEDLLPLPERFDQFIDQNISTVTVQSLCDHFGLGKKELYFETSRHFRKTPGKLIRDKRQELVLQSIQDNPDLTVTELALLVGYSERHIHNILDSAGFPDEKST